MKRMTAHRIANRTGAAMLAGLMLVWPLAAPADAPNTISVGGSGGGQSNINEAAQGSVIDLYQVGDAAGAANVAGSSGSPVSQAGSGHVARIGQGATWSGGVWTPGTQVTGNLATLSQTGAGHQAEIYQTSSGNTATVTQSGAAMVATLTQNGAIASQVTVTQDGSTGYTLTVNQQGAGGHTATVQTTSSYSGAGVSVNQTGSTNSASVTGMSGGTASISQEGSGGYVNLANQSSGGLSVTQQGINNALSITNFGVGASFGRTLSVTQTGIGGAGMTTTYNPDPAPTGPTYSTSKP